MWRLFCGIIFLIAGACHWRANGEVPAGEVTVSKAFAERQAERDRMVREQLKSRDIVHDGVLRAMAKVPRHALVPTQHQTFAYRDHPLPIGEGQTISQPYIVAFMTQAADLQAGERVLEIGTGSGYQAAVLAEMNVDVYSIEIVEGLGRRAATDLKALGYGRIRLRLGDGYQGWPEAAPFDAIVVTAAPGKVPQPLLDQLAVGGRLVIPVGVDQQEMRVIKRTQSGYETDVVFAVRFVPMTGEAER